MLGLSCSQQNKEIRGLIVMTKKGLAVEDVSSFLVSSSDKAGWTLCIGAGTSTPLFPDWFSLADNLAQQLIPDKTLNIEYLKKSGFSPDALIQMVKNSTSLSDADFSQCMSDILYNRFRSKIDERDWNSISKVLQTNFTTNCSLNNWRTFSKYRDTILTSTTAYRIAPVILEAIARDQAPKAILSFNAEPLLLVILNSLLFDNNTDAHHPAPKKVFCKVINSLSSQGHKQIPYIFCHGLLPIGTNSHAFSSSTDKLVFLEEEYLKIANNSFSWQATTFLNACTTQHIVFIGTSLTDPNMRRWLSWAHSNRMNEMQYNGIESKSSTQHYWIRKIPDDKTTVPWIEAIVAHLGVRIIWIEEWTQSSLALEKLLGIKPKNNKITTQTKKPRKKIKR